MKSIVVLIVFSFFSQLAYGGGGWTSGKGHGYFKLSEWWLVADQHFTGKGDIDPNITLGTYTTAIYGEYGLTDKLDVQVYFPFFSRNFHNEEVSGTLGTQSRAGRALNAVGDLDIGIKYGLITGKKIVLSAHLMLGLPTGKSSFDIDSDEIALGTGDGEFNQLIGLNASTSHQFGSTNAFATLGAEFNSRTKGFSDQTRVNVEFGGTFKEKLTLVYKLQWLNSLQNGDVSLEDGVGIFSNNIEYVSFTYELGYAVTNRFGLAFGVGGVYLAKLILANPSYSMGVYMKI